MAPKNLHSDRDVTDLWFTKFFVGSMVSIAFLTIVLSFLPSPSALRNQPQNKSLLLPSSSLSTLTTRN